MTVPQHIIQRVSQLRAEQAQWEGVRQQINAKLLEHANREQESGTESHLYYDNELEQLRSQAAAALFHVQEIRQELTQIREQLEADAREQAAHDPELVRQELVKRDDARNEQLAKEAADKLEALRKEEAAKAAALEKEQRDKEFFDKKEADRQEAAAKEERDKGAIAQEERDKQDALQQSDVELLADINAEWEYALGQIEAEWEYVDQQIHEEVEYSVGQTLDVVSEVAFEVGKAAANSISPKEAEQFLDTHGKRSWTTSPAKSSRARPPSRRGCGSRKNSKSSWQPSKLPSGAATTTTTCVT